MKQITIRGVPDDVARALKQEKQRRGTSLNQTLLELLRQALGLDSGQYDNGLSRLAGTWDADELAKFTEATEAFGHVDPELWQ